MNHRPDMIRGLVILFVLGLVITGVNTLRGPSDVREAGLMVPVNVGMGPLDERATALVARQDNG